jgi:hypothetical protein
MGEIICEPTSPRRFTGTASGQFAGERKVSSDGEDSQPGINEIGIANAWLPVDGSEKPVAEDEIQRGSSPMALRSI